MKWITLFLLTSCNLYSASIVELNKAQALETTQCNVRVFTSKEAATAEGPIIERAIISGTSAPSTSHTVGTAINKHKDTACEYGADNVYVKSSSPADFGPASVELVAFSFKKETAGE